MTVDVTSPKGTAVRHVVASCVIASLALAALAAEPAAGPRSPQEVMGERGFVRHRGAWRTVQEIELIERAERANLARKEWVTRLERLRRQLDQPAAADRAAEEIRGIADAAAVPAVVAALGKEPVPRVRGWYVEALARIRSPDAVAALISAAVDHPDDDTRILATDRLVLIGPHAAVPPLVAALHGPDNARVNRAAAALGRLGVPTVAAPLIDALQTKHVIVQGGGSGEGAMTAGFTPDGGGLSMGGGPKKGTVVANNARVLEALIALTGKNFEWDAAAWRTWLASTQSPPPGYDPRRGGP
jgi:hypothetical protein